MEFVQIKDITTQKEGESINLRASLQFRTELTKWKRKASKTTMRSPGGFKITGILVDSTSSIDFVSWTNKFDDILKTDETFELSHVKVSLIKREYARTEHECQLVLEDSSSITPLNIEPFVPPLNVAPIAELNTYSSGSSVSVVGKVLHISAPEPFYSQQIVKARLRDNTGVIQYSLIGNAIKNCNFGVNDVLLLQNVQLKIFGALHVLVGSTGMRKVNPSDRDYSCFLPTATTPCAEMSPDRKKPERKMLLDISQEPGSRSEVESKVLKVDIKEALYDKCPAVKCNSRVVLLDNALYRCGKCGKDYFVSCSGLKLSVDVGDDTSRKAVVLFNDTAEKFLERNMKQILVMDSAEIQALEKSLTGRMCTFILKPGRTSGEYLCDSFKFQTMPTQPPMKKKLKFGIDALLS